MLKSNTHRCLTRRLTFLLLTFILISVTVMFCSCGLPDWSYDLPNGYSIWRSSFKSIDLVLADDSGDSASFVIEQNKYVSYFSYNDTYVAVKYLELPEDIAPEEIEAYIEKTQEEYCILNTKTADLTKGLTRAEYEQMLIDLEIDDMCDWISTLVAPDGSY